MKATVLVCFMRKIFFIPRQKPEGRPEYIKRKVVTIVPEKYFKVRWVVNHFNGIVFNAKIEQDNMWFNIQTILNIIAGIIDLWQRAFAEQLQVISDLYIQPETFAKKRV